MLIIFTKYLILSKAIDILFDHLMLNLVDTTGCEIVKGSDINDSHIGRNVIGVILIDENRPSPHTGVVYKRNVSTQVVNSTKYYISDKDTQVPYTDLRIYCGYTIYLEK